MAPDQFFEEEGSRVLTANAFEFVLDGELRRALRSQNFLTLVVLETRREWEGLEVTADDGTVEEVATVVGREVRDTDLLGGLEMGGIPIVTVVSAQTGLPALFVRKQAKTYGTCKLAEGPPVDGRRVTLIEDVITTGGAVRDATLVLREAGAVVDTVVCAIDRSPGEENPLADVGLEVRSVLTKADLDAVRG